MRWRRRTECGSSARSTPQDGLGCLAPERVRCGHGPGVDEDAAAALEGALADARRRFPRALAAHGRKQAGTVLAALRS